MILRELAELFNNELASGKSFHGEVFVNEPLSQKTTIKIGGNAPLFLQPHYEEDFLFAVKILRERGARFFVLGGGSNVVFSDSPDFAVISTKKLDSVCVSFQNEKNVLIRAGAGASWGKFASQMRKNRIGDFAPFSALPGTVGGALFMNANCFGFCASENLKSVRFLDAQKNEILEYKKNANDWDYKKSPFQDGKKIILEAEFFAEKFEEKEKLDSEYKKFAKMRAEKGHFLFPSAGSVFKNDEKQKIIAGKIIDECGLKGLQIGGAKIADFHGNFIVNVNGATAADVKNLAEKVKKIVFEKTGVNLQEEVVFA